jgi:hypothetical protein
MCASAPVKKAGTYLLASAPRNNALGFFDAFSLNYRVILAKEGCFDRSEASHAVSLCDMHAKYADVVSTAEILSYFDQLPADLFDLPAGRRSPATLVKEAAE